MQAFLERMLDEREELDDGADRGDDGDGGDDADDEQVINNVIPPVRRPVPPQDVIEREMVAGTEALLERVTELDARFHFEGSAHRVATDVGRCMFRALRGFGTQDTLRAWLRNIPSTSEMNQSLYLFDPPLLDSPDIAKLKRDGIWNRAIDAISIVMKVKQILDTVSYRLVSELVIREALRKLPELPDIGFTKTHVEQGSAYGELQRLKALFADPRLLNTHTPSHPSLPRSHDGIDEWHAKWTVILVHTNLFKGPGQVRQALFSALHFESFAAKWVLTQQALNNPQDERFIETILSQLRYDVKAVVTDLKKEAPSHRNASRDARKSNSGFNHGNGSFRPKFNKFYRGQRDTYAQEAPANTDFRSSDFRPSDPRPSPWNNSGSSYQSGQFRPKWNGHRGGKRFNGNPRGGRDDRQQPQQSQSQSQEPRQESA